MATIAHDTIAPLVKDQLYAMKVENLRDAAFKHSTIKQNGTFERTFPVNC